MEIRLEPSWQKNLAAELNEPYFKELTEFLKAEYASTTVYPHFNNLFRAFELTPFDAVRVVILGQDPYHGEGQAHGLSFSVEEGVRNPPSLRNIFRELQSDIGGAPNTGDLTEWAEQGVLLLNATLSVRAGQASSHQGKGWEKFTDAVIRTLSEERERLVFILWGNYARSKKALIDSEKHCIIESVHPSPLSAHGGFFGSKPFSKVNAYLKTKGDTPIDWLSEKKEAAR